MTRTTTPRRDDAGSRQSAPENRSRAATAAYPTKNDLPEAARGEAVALLNQRLADCIDLQTQCKQAHWNVKGPTFIALHKLFDEINEDVEGYVDLIAERIVQLGGIAEGTVGVVADRAALLDYPLALAAGAESGAARGGSTSSARRPPRSSWSRSPRGCSPAKRRCCQAGAGSPRSGRAPTARSSNSDATTCWH